MPREWTVSAISEGSVLSVVLLVVEVSLSQTGKGRTH